MMNKRELFQAAVAGEKVDRAPRTCWAHFMTENLGGAEHARRHIMYQDEYDWDILKVVNDFHYPFPKGLETISGPEDMAKFDVAPMTEYLFREELLCLQILRDHYGSDLPIVFTTFDPWHQIVRRAGRAAIPVLLAHPEDTLHMLRKVGESMCTFMGELRKGGCDGVFFGLNSCFLPPSPFAFDDNVYQTFMRPFEIEMLEAMSGMVRFIHAHGVPVGLDRLEGYPYEMISVSDGLEGNPSLAEARKATGKPFIGGINEGIIVGMTADEMRANIAHVLQETGEQGLILAPGCTIPEWTPAHLLHILARHDI